MQHVANPSLMQSKDRFGRSQGQSVAAAAGQEIDLRGGLPLIGLGVTARPLSSHHVLRPLDQGSVWV